MLNGSMSIISETDENDDETILNSIASLREGGYFISHRTSRGIS
jgi:hypothetical protein